MFESCRAHFRLLEPYARRRGKKESPTLADIEWAVLETSGRISFIERR